MSYQGVEIIFDPIFENPFSHNCYAFPEIEFDHQKIKKLNFSAIFISHFHDDHCSLVSLDLLNRNTPIFLYCIHEELFKIIRQLGFKNIFSLKLNESIIIGDFEIIPREALDIDVDCLFQIKVADFNILNVVDSWISIPCFEILQHQGPWDLILWPFQNMQEIEVISPRQLINSKSTLQQKIPIELIEQLKILKPRYLVPSSCQFRIEPGSWYNSVFFPVSYKSFQLEIETHLVNTKIIRMNPGVSLILNIQNCELSNSLDWIKPIGDQNVDYEYNAKFNIPKMNDLVNYFPILDVQQILKLKEFCESEIFERFNNVFNQETNYFQKQKYWRLTILNSNTEFITYYYQISIMKLERISYVEEIEIQWTTDIFSYKLYSALFSGESLTSLFIRVNDFDFTELIHNELVDFDPLEDPLIQVLFNQQFAAYQKNQLKNILGLT